MNQYHELLRHVMTNGVEKSDRTGTGTKSVFGYQMRFDLKKGFPLITTKKLHTKSIIHELLWFLQGETNIAYLKQHGVSIFNEKQTFRMNVCFFMHGFITLSKNILTMKQSENGQQEVRRSKRSV